MKVKNEVTSSYKTPLLTLCVFGKDGEQKNKRTSLLWELSSIFMSILGEKIILSFEANSFFSLAESPLHDLPITAYK